jgi:hypothetical protein
MSTLSTVDDLRTLFYERLEKSKCPDKRFEKKLFPWYLDDKRLGIPKVIRADDLYPDHLVGPDDHVTERTRCARICRELQRHSICCHCCSHDLESPSV